MHSSQVLFLRSISSLSFFFGVFSPQIKSYIPRAVVKNKRSSCTDVKRTLCMFSVGRCFALCTLCLAACMSCVCGIHVPARQDCPFSVMGVRVEVDESDVLILNTP